MKIIFQPLFAKPGLLLLVCAALLLASVLHADPLVYYPVNGSGDGAIGFNINSGFPYTSFGDDYWVDSLSGRYSYVRPLNGSFARPTAFYDTDYTESLGNYSPASYGFSLLYKLSVFGHPRVSPDDETAYPNITPGISADLDSVPAGKYCLEYTVKDESTLDPCMSGDVRDADCVVPVDVYIMDLAEKTRTVYLKQDDVYRIDLSTVPAVFPHENLCYISVGWSLTPPMPGMPSAESDLYTSADCSISSKILPDTFGGVSKKWQMGSAPHYIYYKKPDNGSKDIFLWLYAETTSYQPITLSEKTLSFGTTALYCHKASASGSDFAYYEYVNNTLMDKSYPRGLWKDNETLSATVFDGLAYEDYPYQNDEDTEDKNTPFIAKKGDKLNLTSLELTDTGTNTYNGDTDFITGANPSFPFGSSHFDVVNSTGYKKLICRSDMESSQAVSNTVGIKKLTLPWKVQTYGGSNIAAGSCDIKVYVPLFDPIASGCPGVEWHRLSNCNSGHTGLFEDLLSLSCSAAEGASTQSEVFDLLWKYIRTLQMKNLNGQILQYWGHDVSTPNEHDSTASLLREADGTCGDWSSLFVDLLRSQGISANYVDNVYAFHIGTIPSANIVYDADAHEAYYNGNQYSQNSYICLRQQAKKYQGGGHPDRVIFQDHAINIYDGNYYDATCGNGGYDTFEEYLQENCSITLYDLSAKEEYTLFAGSQMDPDYFDRDVPNQGN